MKKRIYQGSERKYHLFIHIIIFNPVTGFFEINSYKFQPFIRINDEEFVHPTILFELNQDG